MSSAITQRIVRGCGQPVDPIIRYYSSDNLSIFSSPMTREKGVGDVTQYFFQAPLFTDRFLTTQRKEEFLTFKFTVHTINDTILPYIDELSIFFPEGNLTAFTNLDVVNFELGSTILYGVAEAQGVLYGRQNVVIEIDENGLRTVWIG